MSTRARDDSPRRSEARYGRDLDRGYRTRSRSPRDYRDEGRFKSSSDRYYRDFRDDRDRDRFRQETRRFPRRRRPALSPSQRETPQPSNVLGVFGLSILTHEKDLETLFGAHAPIQDISIIYDKHTGKSRGFGFITFHDQDGAARAREAMNGHLYNDRKMRVDFSLTTRAHSPFNGKNNTANNERGNLDRESDSRRDGVDVSGQD